MELIRNNKVYSIDKLREDKKFVEERFKYEDGAFGHCISLPSIYDLKEPYLSQDNNIPLRGVLDYTPYFKEIYDSFKTEVTSFRLLRRKTNSSYGLHNDKDIGKGVKRFQIPIVTNDKSWLCITNQNEIEEGWTEENSYTMEDFGERFKGRHDSYQLEPGRMYHFDVTKIHTLFNNGDTDRVTLLIDVKVNDWLLKFIEGFKSF
jgi:hypothetical protein|tara:strand:+ start:2062 stop:2673 length:612 start_codon:yes stop_codon:yes gene_type:complete